MRRLRRGGVPALLVVAAFIGTGPGLDAPARPGPDGAAVAPPLRLVAESAPAACDPRRVALVDETPYALRRLGARRVWPRATGAEITVAVVDSGVDPGNTHLGAAVVPGTSLVPGDPDPTGQTDVTSHGTAVAGIVAAREVPGSGVIGLARDARVLPVRVYVSEEQEDVVAGRGPEAARTAAGIRYAADAGARIIAVPLSSALPDPELDTAVAYATAAGSLVVASAGNREESPDTPDGPRWPAASPDALGVGAVDTADTVPAQSVRGPHVDVVAPGTDVLTTYFAAGDCALEPDGGATSWATGYAAGAAALVAQAYPEASPAEIAYRMQVTADRPVRSARDDARGWGLIQPLEAVTAGLDPNRAGPPLPGAPTPSATGRAPQRIDVVANRDPAADQKSAGRWWLLLGGGVVGLALLAAGARAARRRTG